MTWAKYAVKLAPFILLILLLILVVILTTKNKRDKVAGAKQCLF